MKSARSRINARLAKDVQELVNKIPEGVKLSWVVNTALRQFIPKKYGCKTKE